MIEIKLKGLLEAKGQTFYWLSKETGIGHTSLWRLRHGEAKGISFDFLERICRALQRQPGDLLVQVGGGKAEGKRKVKGK